MDNFCRYPDGLESLRQCLRMSDIDGDHDLDLLIGNDFGQFVEPNQLWRNDGPTPSGWAFVEIGQETGFGIPMQTMGIATADVDLDGDLDRYLSNIGRPQLLLAEGAGFVDAADTYGLAKPNVSFVLPV